MKGRSDDQKKRKLGVDLLILRLCLPGHPHLCETRFGTSTAWT